MIPADGGWDHGFWYTRSTRRSRARRYVHQQRLRDRQAERLRGLEVENIDLEPDQLDGKTLELVWFPLSKSGLEGDVLSFQEAQLA